MLSEITEERDEELNWFINSEAQKEKIRQIIRHQKSQYSSSSSAASCSSFSSSNRSLLELMKGGNTSLRRLFEMEHTSLASHFEYYSGSPLIKHIPLWGSDDSEREFEDPWSMIKLKQIGPTQFLGSGDRESGIASKGSFNNIVDADYGSPNRNGFKTRNRRLKRKKSFRRLPGFGIWRCGRFNFRLRLRRFKLLIYCKKLRRKLQICVGY